MARQARRTNRHGPGSVHQGTDGRHRAHHDDGDLRLGLAQQVTGLLPDSIAVARMRRAGLDRLSAFYTAIDAVRRGGTISVVGSFATHRLPLDQAPEAYEMFQTKSDNVVKVLLRP